MKTDRLFKRGGQSRRTGKRTSVWYAINWGHTVSYFKNGGREGGFPAHGGSNTWKQKHKLHPLKSTEKKKWHAVQDRSTYKMRRKWWMNTLYSVSTFTGDINAEIESWCHSSNIYRFSIVLHKISAVLSGQAKCKEAKIKYPLLHWHFFTLSFNTLTNNLAWLHLHNVFHRLLE